MALGVCVLALASALGLLLLAHPVQAHANLVRALPEPNSVLDQAPTRVAIWFTEPLEPSLSEIRVLDSAGAAVDNGNSQVDANDPTAMSVGLSPVPSGTYTVAWKNVSTVDGHRVRGAFLFSVGQPLEATSPEAPQEPLFQSPLEPALRWLALLAVLAMTGGLLLELLVMRPVFLGSSTHAEVRGLAAPLASRTLILALIASGVFLAASVAQLLLQASVIHEVSIFAALGSPVGSVLADTQWGGLWVWRVALSLGFVGSVATVLVLSRRPGLGHEDRPFQVIARLLALGVACAILWTLSLTSHGAATPGIRTAALLADYMHLLAVSFWVGGLFHFALAIPLISRALDSTQRQSCLAALVPRFSVLASLSVGVLIVTGVFGAWAQVTVPPALNTPYGLTLVAKLAMVLPLLLLGGMNLLWVRPRLSREQGAGKWLKRFVAGEVVLAILVLASVGVLTSLEPARQVASRQGIGVPASVSFLETVEGTTIALEIAPARVGRNNVTVSLADRLGETITNATDVALRLSYLEADLGEAMASLEPSGAGLYELKGSQLSIAGPWQAELVVRRPDAFDARTAFRFEASPVGTANSAAIAPSQDMANILLGAGLGLLGLLFMGTGLPLGGWFSRAGAGVMLPGLVGFLVGMGLLAGSQFAQPDGEAQRNPFPPDQASLQMGQTIYQQSCLSCHGSSGRGDGGAATGLLPPPADLVVHVPLHPDQDLFRFIHDGIPDTAMTPLGGQLTDEEIWHVINFIKTLEE